MKTILQLAIASICIFISLPVSVSSSLTEENPNYEQQLRRALKDDAGVRSYNILALGGGVTDGATIPRKALNSFPALIGVHPNTIRNAAVRSTGAGFVSHCVETLAGDENYDVILLEFSLNGHKGLDLLLKRLRHRYPDAIIIYVHLYSLEAELINENGATPQQTNTRIESGQLKWGGKRFTESNEMFKEIKNTVSKYGGLIYELPRTGHAMNSVYLFAPDWHHLSIEGHQRVATDVLKLIQDAGVDYSREKTGVGSWGDGDQCSSWLVDGKVDLEYSGAGLISMPGAQRNILHFALAFRSSGSLFVENKKSINVPVFMSFMTKKDVYPRVEIEINSSSLVIDSLSEFDRDVMRTVLVGWAKPGMNEIMIMPVSKRQLAFRVTGINLCGACVEFSNSANMVMHEDLH